MILWIKKYFWPKHDGPIIDTALLRHSSCDSQNGRSTFAPFSTFIKRKHKSARQEKKILNTSKRVFSPFYCVGLLCVYQRSCSINVLISICAETVTGKLRANCLVTVLVNGEGGLTEFSLIDEIQYQKKSASDIT